MSFKPRYIRAKEAEERIVALYRKEKGDAAKIFNSAIDACQTIILDMYDNSSENVVSVVRCRDCKHFRLNVFGEEIGIGKPYDCLIVGHEMCDAWSDGCKTDPEGFCFMGERREDGEA